jgi:hypothetical protein
VTGGAELRIGVLGYCGEDRRNHQNK